MWSATKSFSEVRAIKVREALNNPASLGSIPGKDDRKISDSRESTFQGYLKRVESSNLDERINELVTRIVEQGEKLGKKVDIRELKVYKRLVADFLNEAVGNSHEFSKRSLLDRRGRHKVYALVRKINEELSHLTEEVLSSEKDNIKVLQRLDDIRGLILDLTL